MVKNEKTEYHLCEICAKNIKLNLKLQNYSDSLQEILTFLDNDRVEAENRCCLNCGLTFAELKKNMKIGCPSCYHYHGESLKSVVPDLAEAKRHIGTKPDNFINIEKDADADPRHLYDMLTRENHDTNNTEDLREKLEIAVSEERYEDAAILRDMVKELERVK
jgi:protein arginine kinase activator